MTQKKRLPPPILEMNQICFGLDRATDEISLQAFLNAFSNPALLEILLPRMADKEIDETVNALTGLMKKHFSEKEYHRFFLDRPERQETKA